jgi:hypothetical protein
MACIIIQLGRSLAPLLPGKELEGIALTLESGIRYVSNKVRAEGKHAVRQNGTGKCTVKALAFRPRRRTSPSLSMVA